MRRLSVCLLAGLVLICASRTVRSAPARLAAGTPTIDDLISLKRAGSPAISPDGKLVAYIDPRRDDP